MPKAIVEALQHNMRRALISGSLSEADSILEHLKREDPLSVETRGLELEYCLNSGRLAEAEALAGQLRSLFPGSARIAFLAGRLDYRLKRYESAAAHFSESLRLFPHWRTSQWLGKTLTQLGRFGEAEALLIPVLEKNRNVLLDLAWLHERREDLEAALKALDEFLALNPENSYAAQQRMRLRARMLEPEALIDEVGVLAELDEEIPLSLFPEYVKRLFETGQSPRARKEIEDRIEKMDARCAAQVAWICYKAQAYDLACTLFLAQLALNKSNFKYLAALENAADKCRRLPEVMEAYRTHLPETKHFHGRLRSLSRRNLS